MRYSQFSIAFLCSVVLAGCASPDFVNEQGVVRPCPPIMGIDCPKNLIKQGYLPLDEAGVIGVLIQGTKEQTAYISYVYPESPAEKAGIKVHDVIVAVDGREVTSNITAKVALFGRAGKPVEIQVKREGLVLSFVVIRAPFSVGRQR